MKLRIGTAILLTMLATLSFSNMIVNGDFENPVVPSTQFFIRVPTGDSTTITGWTVFGPVGSEVSVDAAGYLAVPTQSIDLTGDTDVPGSGIQQSVATTVGQQYQVQFKSIGAVGGYSGSPVQWLIDGTALGTTSASNTVITFNFVAANAATVLAFKAPNGGIIAKIDNVSMDAVPEPCSMLALGGLALMFFRKRRR